MIETPCLGICSLIDGKCLGCNRTEKEITNWLFLSDKERMIITKRCLKQIESQNKRNK